MSKTPEPLLSMERTKAFSDGVLAIIITLLVLGIELPPEHLARGHLIAFLKALGSDLNPYLASFALVATFWVQHTVILQFVDPGNRMFQWLNGLFLLPLSLLPFATKLRAEYPSALIVEGLFGGLLIASSLVLLVMWHYAAGHRLIAASVSADVIHSMSRRILITPLVTVLGVSFSFVNAYLGALCFISLPFFYLSHRTVDTHWGQETSAR